MADKNVFAPDRFSRSLQNSAIKLGNRIADLLLGAYSHEVLNPGPPLARLKDPSRALKQAANAMTASSINLATGSVDYKNLSHSEAYTDYRELSRSLPHCKLTDLGDRDQQIAFWINLYNALIIDAIIRFEIRGSLSRHPGLFRKAAYNVGGMRFSADDIEHGILRGNQRHPYLPLPLFAMDDPRLKMTIRGPDPRVHFALVCGARSCPPIGFYEAEHLDEQLDKATKSFINGGGLRYESDTRTLWLSKIFAWYKSDFGGMEGVLREIQKHTQEPELKKVLAEGQVQTRYLKYDWSVNTIP